MGTDARLGRGPAGTTRKPQPGDRAAGIAARSPCHPREAAPAAWIAAARPHGNEGRGPCGAARRSWPPFPRTRAPTKGGRPCREASAGAGTPGTGAGAGGASGARAASVHAPDRKHAIRPRSRPAPAPLAVHGGTGEPRQGDSARICPAPSWLATGTAAPLTRRKGANAGRRRPQAGDRRERGRAARPGSRLPLRRLADGGVKGCPAAEPAGQSQDGFDKLSRP